MNKKQNVIIYQSGEIELKVSINNETIWLRAEDIALLFAVQKPAIVKHIGNIYKSGELDEKSTCSVLEQVTKDGKKRKVKYYNLDVIISVGYKVNSIKATKFRQWATKILKGRKRSYFTINKNDLRTPARINNSKFYVETDLSANSIVSILKELLLMFGYNPNDVEIKIRNAG